jgi:hypothetical protein
MGEGSPKEDAHGATPTSKQFQKKLNQHLSFMANLNTRFLVKDAISQSDRQPSREPFKVPGSEFNVFRLDLNLEL